MMGFLNYKNNYLLKYSIKRLTLIVLNQELANNILDWKVSLKIYYKKLKMKLMV